MVRFKVEAKGPAALAENSIDPPDATITRLNLTCTCNPMIPAGLVTRMLQELGAHVTYFAFALGLLLISIPTFIVAHLVFNG